MTLIDRIILMSALVTSILSAGSVVLLSVYVARLWNGFRDRKAVEAVKAGRQQ